MIWTAFATLAVLAGALLPARADSAGLGEYGYGSGDELGTYAPGGALSGDHDGTVDADIDGIMDGDGGTGGAMTADAMGNDFGGDGTGGVGDDAGLEDAVIMEADDGAACVAGDGTCTQGATSDGNGPGGRGGGFFSNQVDPDSGNTFDVAAPTDPATGNGAVGIGAAGASAVAAALAAAWIAAM